MPLTKGLSLDLSMLALSRDKGSDHLFANEKTLTYEAPWKQYARAMLPLSPVAKKSRENEMTFNFPHEESDKKRDTNSKKPTFDQQDERRDIMTGVELEPHNCLPRENNSPKQNHRNAMLRRLADCFAYRHKCVKSGTRRQRVMGFYPQLYTIHENASELASDLELNYQMAESSKTNDTDLLENDESKDFDDTDTSLTLCCNTNDQKIAALHEDIKELWKRLENVEREFAWAKGNLLTRNADSS